MSYPPRRSSRDTRRLSGSYLATARMSTGSASEEDSSPPLAPPRPFFLAGGERGSWSASSMDNSSLDPPSDSDREAPLPPPPLAARAPAPRTAAVPAPRSSTARAVVHRNHHRRRSSMASSTAAHSSTAAAAVAAGADTTQDSTPAHSEADHGQMPNWSPDTLYQDAGIASPNTPGSTVFERTSRPPPSSFPFPFQQYPGNPDPGLGIPGVSHRRSSLESVGGSGYHPLSHSSSLTDLRRPYAPFMQGTESGSVTPPNASSNSLYRNSVAANMMPGSPTPINEMGVIPRSASTQTFRAPFLSPASRPNSTLWSPPPHHNQVTNLSPNASSSALAIPALPKKAPLPSTRLAAPIEKSEKPWLTKPDPRTRLSWWLTFLCIVLGIGGAAALCWRGFAGIIKLDPNQLCLVLDEEFNGPDLDDSVWSRDVELGGFGNGEFQMTTDSSDNLFFRNSQLYMFPTLSEDAGININDGTFTLDGCTTDNTTACSATANGQTTVINPIRSARINTKGKKSIKFGRVEFKAKLPKGDWLWPAVWMLPDNETYGPWPASGEIDIIEARGNGPEYSAQGSNFIRSTLNYGPLAAAINQIFGWQALKRSSFDQEFHTYALEWDDRFMRFFVDSRIHVMLDIRTTGKNEGFWDRAGFPQTVQNGSSQAVVQNPYGDSKAAPFDQSFYLIIDLAAGGTSGWFPDKIGNKPWFDGSNSAMRDFANAKDTWFATWPESQEDRSFRIDYVKMWEKC